MAKKDFTAILAGITKPETERAKAPKTDAELKDALVKEQSKGRGRPKKWEGSQRVDGYIRATTIVNKEQFDKLKEISFKETVTLKDLIAFAIDQVIDRYEQAHGAIKPKTHDKKEVANILGV